MRERFPGFMFELNNGYSIEGFDTLSDCVSQAIREAYPDKYGYLFPVEIMVQGAGKFANLVKAESIDELISFAVACGASVPLELCPRISKLYADDVLETFDTLASRRPPLTGISGLRFT